MTLPPDWTETTVSGVDRPERVYRKHVAGLVCTLDAQAIDRCALSLTGGLAEVLQMEWARFVDVQRRYA